MNFGSSLDKLGKSIFVVIGSPAIGVRTVKKAMQLSKEPSPVSSLMEIFKVFTDSHMVAH
jgi:hypothetical protein